MLSLRPLETPTGWDELMYHLPYAEYWARSGKIEVNVWLRYPLFAYNLDLLYAASMLIGNDIIPHFIHALCGVLSIILAYSFSKEFANVKVGVVSVFLIILSSKLGMVNCLC